jgi:hypothetical protein
MDIISVSDEMQEDIKEGSTVLQQQHSDRYMG